ncbi:GDSL-type esterase/lipase family protein [Nocardia sp. NPDC059240]|uniref:GDSL-type esterase/lipase family protein n=1 Tax=Nocardia sp. NPDC059240 TaxID=3346786 RepID=UPI0036860958
MSLPPQRRTTGLGGRGLRVLGVTVAATLRLGLPGLGVGPAAAEADSAPECGGSHWVGSWAAAPSDWLGLADPALVPQVSIADQTYRIVVTPHLGGSTLRIHLTNRYRPLPLTIGAVTVGVQTSGAGVDPESLRPVTFSGRTGATIAAGDDLVSDPIELPVQAWQRLAVSVHLPESALLPTEHFDGEATSYYALPGTGDHTADAAPDTFALRTTAVPLASGIDVQAPGAVSSLVALGDSITDGYVASNVLGVPQDSAVVDTDSRYPDFLQRRLDAAGHTISVLDLGISGNRVLAGGFIPQFGPSTLDRLDHDVLAQAGVTDVILLEGINDLGIPIGADYEQLVAAYTTLIARMKTAGLHVHLGTLTPAANAVTDGLSAPLADGVRLRLNDWIRHQTLADSVIDFAAAVANPADPSTLDPRFAGPDNLHPNPAGYQAMAEAVDLNVLHGSECG